MQKATLITAGYRDSILAVDSYFEGVTFRSTVGAYYKKDGWVQAGTEFLYNPNDPNLGAPSSSAPTSTTTGAGRYDRSPDRYNESINGNARPSMK